VKPNCNSLDSCLRSVPDWLQVLLALAAVAGLTVFKLTIGQSVSVIDFLFVPIVAVGWFARRRWLGYVVAGVAAVDTAFVAMTAETQASLAAAMAAALVRFCLYLVVLGLLGMMRRERAGDQRAASTDQLTGAANARAFEETARREVERAQRYRGPISVAYLDIDDFKSVNDALGHGEGDHVLAQTGHVLRSTLRATDTAARIGGDEFAVLMPETGSAGAAALMERVRGELDRLTLADGARVCFSVGLATFERPPSSVGELMAAADEVMYRAKRAGKGRMERTSHGAPRPVPGLRSDGRHTRDLIAR
jgi:diguanylate cyclase (GGDEF)-like protein